MIFSCYFSMAEVSHGRILGYLSNFIFPYFQVKYYILLYFLEFNDIVSLVSLPNPWILYFHIFKIPLQEKNLVFEMP